MRRNWRARSDTGGLASDVTGGEGEHGGLCWALRRSELPPHTGEHSVNYGDTCLLRDVVRSLVSNS